jgi:hypothetical protein
VAVRLQTADAWLVGARRSVAIGVRVSQRPEEVADLVVVAKQPGALEHVDERLLHEVLGIVS